MEIFFSEWLDANLSYFRGKFKEHLGVELEDKDMAVSAGCGHYAKEPGHHKYSCHVVLPGFKMHHLQMKGFVATVLGKPFDAGVYGGSSQNLRLPYCFKPSEHAPGRVERRYNTMVEKFSMKDSDHLATLAPDDAQLLAFGPPPPHVRPPTSGPPSKRQKTQKKAHNGDSEEGFDEEELERIEAKIRKFMSLGCDVELKFTGQYYYKKGMVGTAREESRKGAAFKIKSLTPAQMPSCPNDGCDVHDTQGWLVGHTRQRYCIINLSDTCTQWMELPYEIGDRCEDSPAQQVICWLQDQAKENKLVKDHFGNVHEYRLPHVPTPLLRNGNPLTIAQWVDTNCDQSILNGKVWGLVGGNSRVRLEVIKELEKDTDTHFPVFSQEPWSLLIQKRHLGPDYNYLLPFQPRGVGWYTR